MKQLIVKHNEIVENLKEEESEALKLREVEEELLENFQHLRKEETITYYDQLLNSVAKFHLFLQIRKQWNQ